MVSIQWVIFFSSVAFLFKQADFSRDFIFSRRSGQMASSRTVYLSANRTCSTTSDNVLSMGSSSTVENCLNNCFNTSTCLAFSFLTLLDKPSQCLLFHSCSSTEPCCEDSDCLGCRTGLLPGLQATTELEQDKTTTRFNLPFKRKQMRRAKGPRALRLEADYPLNREEIIDLTKVTYIKEAEADVPCRRITRRACKFSIDSVIALVSSISLNECRIACNKTPNCSNFTYHRQGGGGIQTSSPCVLYRTCAETMWCDGCISGGPTLCQPRKQVEKNKHEDNAIIVLGGYSLDFVDHVEMLSHVGACDPNLPDMPVPKSRGVAQYVDGQVLVCGGRSREESYTRSCEGLALDRGTWHTRENMEKGREDASSTLIGGKMIVLGGWNGQDLLDSVEMYNAKQGTWQEVAGWKLVRARYQHCSASMGDSLVIAGGYPTLRDVEILRLGSGEWKGWEPLTDMRSGRVAHACTVTIMEGRRVLIVSGGQNGGEFLSSVEYLHLDTPEDASWIAFPALMKPRRNHAMLVIQSALLIVGGDTSTYTDGMGFSYQLVGEIEKLVLTDGANWTLTGQMLATPRSVMEAVAVDGEFC